MKNSDDQIFRNKRGYGLEINSPTGNKFNLNMSIETEYKEEQHQKMLNYLSSEVKAITEALQSNFNQVLTVIPEEKQLNAPTAKQSSIRTVKHSTGKTTADKGDRKATDRQLNMVRGILVGLNRPMQEFLNGHKLNSEEEITNRHVAELKEEVQRLKLENPNLNVF